MTIPRWLLNFSLIVILLVLLAFAWFAWQLQRYLYEPLISQKSAPIIVEIKTGTPLIAFAWQLKHDGILKSPRYFIGMAKWRGIVNRIKAGEYLIAPGTTTASQLLYNMAAGKIFLRQITILNGWTFQQVMTTINNNPYLQHTVNNLSPAQIMSKLGNAVINPEGRFYPDTYLFAKYTPDIKILRIAYQKMSQTLQDQWNQRALNLPYTTIDQGLIAASLIEKETALNKEKALIAGVILNRLKQNMRLQIDPTVIYALGNAYQGKLTKQDLQLESPYNTYKIKGLPPGPIAIPSLSSLYAALHPTKTDALYYVSNGNGGHFFSATLEEHNLAIQRYLLAPKFCPAPDAAVLEMLTPSQAQ